MRHAIYFSATEFQRFIEDKNSYATCLRYVLMYDAFTYVKSTDIKPSTENQSRQGKVLIKKYLPIPEEQVHPEQFFQNF